MDFNPNYDEIYRNLTRRYEFSDNVGYFNIHEYLSEERYSTNVDACSEIVNEFASSANRRKRLKDEPTEKEEGNASIVLDNGNLIKEELYYKIGGSHSRIRCYNTNQDEAFEERYYCGNRLYFVRKSDKDKQDYSCLWIKKDGTTVSFPSIRIMRQFWVSELNKTKNAFFCVESRYCDNMLLDNVFDNTIVGVAVVHGSHLQEPYNLSAPLTKKSSFMMKNMNYYDAIVFLTHGQKNYIESQIGVREGTFVIRHPSNIEKIYKNKSTEKFAKRIVMLARLAGIKQVDHAIKAMQKVVAVDSEITLDIYGDGPEKNKLQTLIQELHLEKNVYLKGYTSDPKKKLQESALSIITSKSEALCLSILESLACGTPIIAYDCKFGPGDMIENEKNGFLVPQGDIDGLSKAILMVMENEDI